ncbi:MAG TPA: hypothetical protein PKO06_20565, partial [Candidatus Ozemobacteraceae bacterium]|nr:hypothetical protein [Candidatus Ozemobacteraceae bacterium]
LLNIASQESQSLDSDARRILLAEQNDLLQALEPAEFLQSVHDELDREDGFWNDREGSVRQAEKGVDPRFVTEAALPRRLKHLRERYALQPLYLYFADTDIRTIWWQAFSSLAEDYSANDLEWFGRGHAQFSAAPSRAPTWLPDSRPLMPADRAINERGLVPNKVYEQLAERMFGVYWNRIRLPHDIVQGYSERFSSTIFLCSRFLRSSASYHASTFGGYGAVFSLAQLPRTTILLRALSSTRQRAVAHRSLHFVLPGTPMGFFRCGDHLALQTLLPTEFHHGLPSPAPGLQPALVVATDHAARRNIWRHAVLLFDVCVLACLLVTTASGWYWCRQTTRLSVSSRWKLTAIVTCAGIIPVAVLGFLLLRLLWLSERDYSRRVLALTQSRVRSLASTLEEQLKKGALRLQQLKREVESFSRGDANEQQPAFSQAFWLKDLMKLAFLYRRDGSSLFWPDRDADHQLHEVLQPTSRLFFDELGVIQKTERERTRDGALADTFDFFWGVNRADLAFAQEGLETRSVVSFQEDQRMQFWILASDT